MDWLESSDTLEAQYSAIARTDPQALRKQLFSCNHDINVLAAQLAVHPLVIARYVKEQCKKVCDADKPQLKDSVCKGLLHSPRSLSRQARAASDLSSDEGLQRKESSEKEQKLCPTTQEASVRRPMRVGLLQFPVRSTSADLPASDDQLVTSSCVKISCA